MVPFTRMDFIKLSIWHIETYIFTLLSYSFQHVNDSLVMSGYTQRRKYVVYSAISLCFFHIDSYLQNIGTILTTIWYGTGVWFQDQRCAYLIIGRKGSTEGGTSSSLVRPVHIHDLDRIINIMAVAIGIPCSLQLRYLIITSDEKKTREDHGVPLITTYSIYGGFTGVYEQVKRCGINEFQWCWQCNYMSKASTIDLLWLHIYREDSPSPPSPPYPIRAPPPSLRSGGGTVGYAWSGQLGYWRDLNQCRGRYITTYNHPLGLVVEDDNPPDAQDGTSPSTLKVLISRCFTAIELTYNYFLSYGNSFPPKLRI